MIATAPQPHFRRRTFGKNFERAEALSQRIFWNCLQHPDFSEAERVQLQKIGSKLSGCCRFPTLEKSASTDQVRICPGRCKHRLCPHCARIATNEKTRKVRLIATLMDDPRFITLTIRSIKGESLKAMLDRFNDFFRQFRASKDWKNHVVGGLAVTEITRNEAGWHVHMHCLVDGIYWPQPKALATWETIVGDRAGVDIRKVHGVNSVARYVAKYLAKESSVDNWPTTQVMDFCLATHGLRTLRTFGNCYRITLDEPDHVDAEHPVQPDDWEKVNIFVDDIVRLAEEGHVPSRLILKAADRRSKEAKDAHLKRWISEVWQELKPPEAPKRQPSKQLWLIAIGVTNN